MATTLELTARSIRLIRESRGKIASLESFPIPAGTDPVEALAETPLPSPLGKVTVVLNHGDMLLRTMMQPPAPAERLNRIVRFELQGMSREESEPVAVAWHLVKGMGSGDMRILALLTKRKLLDAIKRGLARHGGKLGSLVHPAVGLYHAYKRQEATEQGDGLVADIGGSNIHLAMIQEGELLLLRSQSPGMDELVKGVAELRGIPLPDAEKLLAKLGKGAPDDLRDLIRRQAQAMAGVFANNVRFTKAQLHLDKFEPKVVYLAGAGARVFGFAEALAERMHVPVRILNPFAGVLSSMPAEEMDQLSALPSPWAVGLGGALTEELELDAVTEERERRANYWRTEGGLRAAAVAAALLLVLAWVQQTFAIATTSSAIGRLQGEGDAKDGLVPKAEAVQTEVKKSNDDWALASGKLAFLDGERRPGRIAVELLAAIAEQQDPNTCPVVLASFRVNRLPGMVEVEIEGFAQTANNRSTADVLRAFEEQLVRHYEPITVLKQLPKPIGSDRQEFQYRIGISDRAAKVLAQTPYSATSGKGLQIKVAADETADPDGLALVMLSRYRVNNEDELKIQVVPADAQGGGTDFVWDVKRGLRRAVK